MHIKADFNAVYLLNGMFAEYADGFYYGDGEPLYVTALPLSAHLLPYTVKIAANKPLSNEKLCAVFKAGGRLYIKLFPRYNYLYSPEKVTDVSALSAPERLFRLVKQKNFPFARKLLSANLGESINDEGLAGFFADYTAIFPDEFSTKKLTNGDSPHLSTARPDACYLITAEGVGSLFYFETAGGLIDNIVEAPKP